MANRSAVGILAVALVLLPSVVSADDLDDLKAAQERYLKAWEARDIDTIVEFEGGTAAGFGYTTAFPRPLLTKEAFRQAMEQYFNNIIDFIRITPHTADFRVLGNTGLVWGHYAQTTKQKSSFIRTVYIRFAHTYMKMDGTWRLVLYHRSLIPNEDIP